MKSGRNLRKVIFISTALLATMACSMFRFGPTPTPRPTATNTLRPGPIPGAWGATIAFALPSGANMVQLSFTVSQAGDKIENWSLFDLGTSSVSLGQSVAIINHSFELTHQDYIGNTNVSRSIKGTFSGPDSVAGTYDFSYGSYGSASGQWTGNPAKAKSTPSAQETAFTPTVFHTTEIKQPTTAAGSGVPVVSKVNLRVTPTSDGPVIYQDIYFSDSDGDVSYVDYSIVYASISGLSTSGGTVDIPSAQQMAGAMITGVWNCGSVDYTVSLDVILTDRVGHQSQPYEYTMKCGNG